MQYHRSIHCSSLDTACTAMYTRKQDTCTARAYKVIVRPGSYKYRSLTCILFFTFYTHERLLRALPVLASTVSTPSGSGHRLQCDEQIQISEHSSPSKHIKLRKVAGVSGLKEFLRDVEDAQPDSIPTRFNGTVYAMLTLPSARSPIAYVIEMQPRDECRLQRLATGDAKKHSAGQEYIVKYICWLPNGTCTEVGGRHRDKQVLNGVGYFKHRTVTTGNSSRRLDLLSILAS